MSTKFGTQKFNAETNILKEDYQRALKEVTFNGQSYQKQKGPGTREQLLFRFKNKFRKIPLLYIP